MRRAWTIRGFAWRGLVVGILGLAAFLALGGDRGLLRMRELRAELVALRRQVAEVERENEALRLRARALREQPAAVRREAAERLLLAPPGSTIYRFDEPQP